VSNIINPYMFLSLKEGLISVWELDETSGGTAYDAHGSNNGTISNATVNQTGKIDKAYDFNGTSAQVTFNAAPFDFDPLAESYTVSMWVKSSDPSPTGDAPYVISRRSGSAGEDYPFVWYCLPASSDNLTMAVFDGSTQITVTITGTDVWDGAWHLVTMVVDHSAGYIYAYLDDNSTAEDSAQITFGSYTTGYYGNHNDMVLGTNVAASPTRWYDGLIDQFAIWNVALTTAKISKLYNSNNGLAYTSW